MTPTRSLALCTLIALVCQGANAQEVVVTRPAAAPLDPSTIITPPASVTAATATQASAQEDPLPASAPKEDYEFVGWCAGVLTGHMMLYERVEPTLKEISKRWNTVERDERENAEKQKIGRDLLDQFAASMRAAENASAAAIAPNGLRAIAQGRAMWSAIDTVDANSRAYSWMNWGLPARCEKTAAKLKSRATLMGAALRDNSASAIQTSAVRLVEPRPDAPAPAGKPADTPVAVAPEAEASAPASAATVAAVMAPTQPPVTRASPPPPAARPPAARTPAPRPTTTPSQAVGLR